MEEEKQEIDIKIRFKVKHSPGTPEHLHQLCLYYFVVKGVPIREDGENLIIDL